MKPQGPRLNYRLLGTRPRIVFESESRDKFAVLTENGRLSVIAARPTSAAEPVMMSFDPGLDARARIFGKLHQIGLARVTVKRQRPAQRVIRLLCQGGGNAERS